MANFEYLIINQFAANDRLSINPYSIGQMSPRRAAHLESSGRIRIDDMCLTECNSASYSDIEHIHTGINGDCCTRGG